MKALIGMSPLAALLVGCVGMGGGGHPSDVVDAEQVIRKIKRDLGDYALYEAAAAKEPGLPNACAGQVAFKVTAINVTLTTLTEVSDEGTVGVEVPIGGITLGPKGAYSRARESSQALSFTLIPAVAEAERGSTNGVPAPAPGTFYAALRGLREAMLKTSDSRPCLTFPKPEDQENSIEFGFTVTRDRSVGGEISFLIFSLGAERKNSEAVGNTVTVAFVAGPGSIFIN